MAKTGIAAANLISRGAAHGRDALYLALQDKKLAERSVAHTRLGMLKTGQISGIKDVPWRAAGLCVVQYPNPCMVAVSGDGDVLTYIEPVEQAERIRGPRDLRACSTIGGYAYACGMARQLYRRENANQWTAMHAPFKKSEGIAGFEAIAAFSPDDLYAAGWEGEIWRFDGKTWSNCDSPVNVILSGVCCAEDSLVYACGQGGALLRGRDHQWEVIDTPDLDDDFWDVVYFKGNLYVASMSALYVLQGDQLVPVDFGPDAPESAYKLTVGDDILWSVGQQNIFSFDGTAWRRWE